MWTIKAEIFTNTSTKYSSMYECLLLLNTKEDISENIGNQLTAQTSKGNFFSCRHMVPNIISVFNREKILTDLEQHENQ